MRFAAQVQIENATAAPDPVAAPEDVPDALIVQMPERVDPGAGDTCARLVLGLIAPLAETVTLELWALLEPPRRAGRPQDVVVAPADRVFLRIVAGLVVTGTQLTQVTTNVPVGGKIYVRRTADALTTVRTLGITCAA